MRLSPGAYRSWSLGIGPLLSPAKRPGRSMVTDMVTAVEEGFDGGPVAAAHHDVDLRKPAALEDGGKARPSLGPAGTDDEAGDLRFVREEAGRLGALWCASAGH